MLLLRLRITNCAQLDMRVGWYFWHMLMHNNALFSPMFIVQRHVLKVQHKCTNVYLCAPDNPPQRSWRVAFRRRLLRKSRSDVPLLSRRRDGCEWACTNGVQGHTRTRVRAHIATHRGCATFANTEFEKKGQDRSNHIGHQTTWICRTAINSCI